MADLASDCMSNVSMIGSDQTRKSRSFMSEKTNYPVLMDTTLRMIMIR